jgi:hypothetical protein
MKLDLFWCSRCKAVKAFEGREWVTLTPEPLPLCCDTEMEVLHPTVDKTNDFGEPIGRPVIFEVRQR